MSTVTARIPEDTAARLEELAQATSRSKSYLVAEALRLFLDTQSWQVARTMDSVRQADAGRFATDQEVRDAFSKWGVDVEAAQPDRLDP